MRSFHWVLFTIAIITIAVVISFKVEIIKTRRAAAVNKVTAAERIGDYCQDHSVSGGQRAILEKIAEWLDGKPEPPEPAGVDWTKPIQTREGTAARFIGILDSGMPYTRIVAVGGAGNERSIHVTETGRFWASDTPHDCDIINVPQPEPEKVELWINIYRNENGRWLCGGLHLSQREADAMALTSREARIHVRFTPGEGLDK